MIFKSNKVKNSWLAITAMFVMALIIILIGCGSDNNATNGEVITGSIKIIGSNTVTPLSSIWAEDFMKMHPKVNVSVSGPGSGAGIAALINGTTDICQASRKIKEKEIDEAKANNREPYEIQVATDALSVIVHPSNPISEITIKQLSAIYTGEVTNWKELGGDDLPIVALARDTNSGTHIFFKEQVVQMKDLPSEDKGLEYGSKVQQLPSTEVGVFEVAKNPKALFYPGLGYITPEVKPLAIKKTADATAILPSVATALDGTYSIARPLLFYTDGIPNGVIKAFVDYCLSIAGQDKVTEVGYVPLQ